MILKRKKKKEASLMTGLCEWEENSRFISSSEPAMLWTEHISVRE